MAGDIQFDFNSEWELKLETDQSGLDRADRELWGLYPDCGRIEEARQDTYLDVAELRLAHQNCSLRFRRGKRGYRYCLKYPLRGHGRWLARQEVFLGLPDYPLEFDNPLHRAIPLARRCGELLATDRNNAGSDQLSRLRPQAVVTSRRVHRLIPDEHGVWLAGVSLIEVTSERVGVEQAPRSLHLIELETFGSHPEAQPVCERIAGALVGPTTGFVGASIYASCVGVRPATGVPDPMTPAERLGEPTE